MSKAKFDPSKFSTRFGTLYYDGQKASQYRIKQYNKYVKGAGGRITSVPKQYSKYFTSGTSFTTRQGHLQSWAKPLTLRGGENPNYNWSRVSYRDFDGAIKKALQVDVGGQISTKGKEVLQVQQQCLQEQNNGYDKYKSVCISYMLMQKIFVL